MRINKYIATTGIASRRGAEELILAGRIAINGVVVRELSHSVAEGDIVTCDGALLSPAETVRLWKYHKPRGVICTDYDPEGRPTVRSQLPEALGRVLLVGRLDVESEGLLLLTNSGEVKRALELPANGLRRTYDVRLYGGLPRHAKPEIEAGVMVEGVQYRPAVLRMGAHGAQSRNQWCEITLQEGKNREVRRIFAHYGCAVNRLRRIAYGDITLGKLAVGAVEEIANAEVTVARMLQHK